MKRALISVSDKTGLKDFAQGLHASGFEIISTGGTKTYLEAAGIPTIAIDQVTNFPEMLDGRVKTLHPAIHGGLLARRDDEKHLAAVKEHGIQLIDLVCVNLYPFKETIAKPETTVAEAIENIDIGGPSMLRSAAKNHAAVTVVVDPADYPALLKELEVNGAVTTATKKRLAAKVFRHTAAYDALIADYFTQAVAEKDPEKVTITYERKQALRYGENSHQRATFYQSGLPEAFSVASAVQLHGKELSYNNIKDTDAAIRIAREFDEPVAVAVKHMNPCGVGTGATIEEAYEACYQADPVSIFGGIVVLNQEVTAVIAEKMHAIFLEIILAPSFTAEALAILTQKKNVRLLQLDLAQPSKNQKEYTSVLGGLLIQDQDTLVEDPAQWECVTKRQPTAEERQALAFAWKVCKHVKSNAIVLATAKQTVGIGAGQMNRVGSVKIACEQAGEKAQTAVLASDAFFPMNDSVEFAAQQGIWAIVQPGGSIKDQESIEMADRHDIAMLVTGVRHFRH